MARDPKLTNEAIIAAGGQAVVARACQVAQPSVFKWTRRGLPRTDWTGETSYAATIARLCEERGAPQYTVERLLGEEFELPDLPSLRGYREAR